MLAYAGPDQQEHGREPVADGLPADERIAVKVGGSGDGPADEAYRPESQGGPGAFSCIEHHAATLTSMRRKQKYDIAH